MAETYIDIDREFKLDLTGQVKINYGTAVINDSIKTILSTNVGERIMNLQFGPTLRNFLFEAMTAGSIHKIKTEVEHAIITFENRILLESVDVQPDYDNNYYTISVYYQIYTTSERGVFEGKLKKL